MWRALGYMFSIAIVVKAIAPEPSCDVCSKYDYEEKLLERVIRNELVLKDTLDKITYTHAKVELTLARIKDDQVKLYEIINVLKATKQNVSEAVQSIMSQTVKDVEVTKQTLRVNVDDFIDSRTRNITATVAEMTSSIQTLVVQTSKALDILRGITLVYI
ncbi:hypothetical protein DPMN_022536 [Dreissena polymorpha]|uniref:Uncharacterized protein n=1 Tax=Dreissena polymorpha TaxID=45954 RepID=A0A9D4NQC2_DREPO|nr:hypothetical protein DPMN_022536 [Dreissena polymorpha]